MKILIVGLDGATWSVMKPLIEKGKLPHLHSIMMEGSSGKLKTIDAEKYLSPPLWMSIDTGKHPEKHGVKDFYKTTRHDVKAKRLFQILDGLDNKVGLFRWYCTWPPEKTNGFTIPSWVARNTETHPPELGFIQDLSRHSTAKGYTHTAFMCLKNGVRYGTLLQGAWRVLHKKFLKPDRRDWYYKERLLETRLYADIFESLYKTYQPNYGAILFSGIDALQHQYWKYYEPDGFENLIEQDIQRYKGVIPAVYTEADRFLGKAIKLLSEDDLLVIVSDHGMHSMKMERGNSRAYQIKATLILRFLHLDARFTTFTANFNTCIMIKNESEKNRTDLIHGAIEQIKNIHIKKTGDRIFDITSIEEDRFFIKFKENIGYDPKAQIGGIPDQTCILYDLIIAKPEISACHHPDGIFLARGPHVKKNFRFQEASLLDIAPTVLRLFNQPVARDMDGRVIKEIIEDEYLEQHPLEEIDSYEDEDETGFTNGKSDPLTDEARADLESRMRSLGYLD